MDQTSLFLLSTFWAVLALTLLKRWAYVVLCALIEVAWVSLASLLGLTATRLNDGGLLFWALSALFFSAVELCLGLFAFVVLDDARGAQS